MTNGYAIWVLTQWRDGRPQEVARMCGPGQYQAALDWAAETGGLIYSAPQWERERDRRLTANRVADNLVKALRRHHPQG